MKVSVRVTQQNRFALLKPVQAPARKENLSILQVANNPQDSLSFIFQNRTHHLAVMALDFETKGDYGAPGSSVVGIGLSDDRGSWYIDVRDRPDVYEFIIHELHTHKIPLIGHNVMFDGGWPVRDFNIELNWVHCTYVLYKLLATEGFNAQRWGLKDAQMEMLGWHDTNEAGLDRWLIDNGYVSNISKEKKDGYYWYQEMGEGEGRWASPRKAEMWRAPPDVLGYYCALDADSTWLLYDRVLLPALNQFRALAEYAGERYIRYIHLLIRQKLSGILVDRRLLEKYNTYLKKKIVADEELIINHKEVKPYADYRGRIIHKEHLDKEPARYKKTKERPPEPSKFLKDGKTISKTWENWVKNKDKYVPALSKNWLSWKEKEKEILNIQHFNPNSGEQKKELFYQFLCKDWEKFQDGREEAYRIKYNGRTIELPATKSGGAPTDKKAMKVFGEVGKLFLDYQKTVKEQQYVHACLMVMDEKNVIRPGFRVPGTLTGRLAGGGYTVRKLDPETGKEKDFSINIQQIPKTAGYLSCMIPRPGHIWVDCDHTALEQVVLAELSKDPTLWTLYGPDAKPNDVYLFNGASLPGIGERIKGAGYDPLNPSAAIIKQVKDKCKKERSVAKVVTLGASYGMGAAKLKRTLMLEGVDVTFQEAKAIHAAYWELYGTVKDYEADLLDMYKDNDGWVLNGIGRPLGIADDYKRDIVNRVVQSTGHDIHVFYILIVVDLLKQYGIPWNPIIIDFHDQMIVEVPVGMADETKYLMGVLAYEKLNELLNGELKLKGDAQIIRNMAEAKVTKEDIEAYLKELGVIDGDDDE